MNESLANLEHLIETTRSSPVSSFYRDAWGGAKDLRDLPTVTREDLIRTPLPERRYKEERGLVKIVRADRPFLSEWSFADIGREAYGVRSKRPMVYMSDPHEAIEKSMWCYENNMVPLIGEKDPALATYAADKYQIDSLIIDAPTLALIEPYLRRRTEPLDSISIIADAFEPDTLRAYRQYAKEVRLVLALPETGAIAEASLAEPAQFRALPGCLIERDGTLIVSKDAPLVTPIIRYRTAIPENVYDGA